MSPQPPASGGSSKPRPPGEGGGTGATKKEEGEPSEATKKAPKPTEGTGGEEEETTEKPGTTLALPSTHALGGIRGHRKNRREGGTKNRDRVGVRRRNFFKNTEILTFG